MEREKTEFDHWMHHLDLNTAELARLMGYKNRGAMVSGKRFQNGKLQAQFVAICEKINSKPKRTK